MFRRFLMITMLVLGAALITACSSSSDSGGDGNTADYTVYFDSDGGSVVPNQEISHGELVEEPTAPVKTGYTFDRWLKDGVPCDFDTPVTESFTLTATWLPVGAVTYTVTFDPDNGKTPYTRTILSGTSFAGGIFPGPPTKDGYIFDGWYTTQGNLFTETTLVNSDLRVTARWNAITGPTHTVTFDPDNGETPYTITVESGTSFSDANFPSEPRKEGYTFEGWFDSDGNPFTVATIVNSDKTVKASWKMVGATYTVSFNPDNGVTPFTITVEEGKSLPDTDFPPVPSKAGYTFEGWFDSDGNPFRADTIVNSDITVTARWNPIPVVVHTVTFNFDNGEVPFTTTVEDGKSLTDSNFPPDPSKTGYTFEGWFDSQNNPFTTTTRVTSDMTVTASWNPIPPVVHTVTFDPDNGTAPFTKTAQEGNSIASSDFPSTPIKTGYVFDGWFDSLNNEFIATTRVNSDMTVTAQWSVQRVRIRLDYNNNTTPEQVDMLADGSELPIPPSYNGKEFLGWNLAQNGHDEFVKGIAQNNSVIEGYMLRQNQTLYAIYGTLVDAAAFCAPGTFATKDSEAIYMLIDNATCNTGSGEQWTSIGKADDAFQGVLYGNRHKVNLGTIANAEHMGLFGYTTGVYISDIQVTANINLQISTISQAHYVGILIGRDIRDSSVINVHTQGTIRINNINTRVQVISGGIGGSLGISFKGHRISSSARIDTGSNVGHVGPFMYAGGLFGTNNGSSASISDAWYSGRVEGNRRSGGIIGSVISGSLTIKNTWVYPQYMTSVSTSGYAGGLVGYTETSSIIVENNLLVNGEISAPDAPANAGRIVGYRPSASSGFNNNYSNRNAWVNGDSVISTDPSSKDGADIGLDSSREAEFFEETLGWDFTNIWFKSSSYQPKLRGGMDAL